LSVTCTYTELRPYVSKNGLNATPSIVKRSVGGSPAADAARPPAAIVIGRQSVRGAVYSAASSTGP
jgi:hypothetical protein